MLIYVILLCIMVIFCFFKKSSKVVSFLITLVLILFAGFRNNTGSDFKSYVEIYNLVKISNLYDYYNNIEVGYKVIIKLSSMIYDSSVLFMFINALLMNGILYLALIRIQKKETLNIIVALLLYYCSFYIPYSFNVMRQGIVMAIFLYALNDIFDRKIFPVIAYTIIGYLIHSSALFILVSYCIIPVFVKINIFRVYRNTCVIIASSFFLYISNFMVFIINVLSPGKIILYQTAWGELNLSSVIFRFVLFVIVFFGVLNNKRNEYLLKLYYLYLVGLALYITFFNVGMLATRFNMFFRIIEILIFSMMINNLRGRINRILIIAVVFILSVSQLYINVINPDNYYKFVFGG
ncbi:TPA: EpsG family protein [Photobacterium damselae]